MACVMGDLARRRGVLGGLGLEDMLAVRAQAKAPLASGEQWGQDQDQEEEEQNGGAYTRAISALAIAPALRLVVSDSKRGLKKFAFDDAKGLLEEALLSDDGTAIEAAARVAAEVVVGWLRGVSQGKVRAMPRL